MQCLTTPSFKVIVSDITCHSSQPKRGIRQDDPLSLSMYFHNYAEYLGRYIQFMSTQETYGVGITLDRDCPKTLI